MSVVSIVVYFDVLEYRLSHLLPSREPFAVNRLYLERAEEALGAGIVVVEPLDAVPVALVEAVDAQVAGAAAGEGFVAFADADRAGAGLVDVAAPALVAVTVAQVVQVAVGDSGQAGPKRV